jgi:Uma2 family endonuclease
MTVMLNAAKWKIDDYHRMIDAGILIDRHVELLMGEIIKMPPEGEGHTYFSDRLAKLLLRLLGDRAQVREGRPITLSDHKDLETKRRIYAGAGIQEYWVINLKAKELIVFRDPIDRDYQARTTLSSGTISPISFPDLVLEVSKMFNR